MIYIGGDSYAEGAELENYKDRYGDLIANAMNTEYLNDARGGASNQRIVRKFFENFDPEKFSHVIIGWTGLHRFEYYSLHDQDDDHYRRVTANRVNVRQLDNDLHPKLKKRIKDLNTDPVARKESKSLAYYLTNLRIKRAIHAEFIQHVQQVQKMCKFTDTKLVMFFGVEGNKVNINEEFKSHLQFDKVDWEETWLRDPEFSLQKHMDDLKLPIGPGNHFLEEGHKLAAEMILEKLGV